MPVVSNQAPHICFVAPYAYPVLAGDPDIPVVGGAEVQQVIVARALVARGYRVSVVGMDFGQKDGVCIDGVRVYKTYRPDEGLPIVRFVWPRLTRIWASLSRANADIYYQRTAGMLTGVMAYFCLRNGKKSIYATASNLDLSENEKLIRYWRDRRIFEYGLRHVDRIFVQNPEQARLCRENVGRDPVQIPNVYHAKMSKNERRKDFVLWVSTIRKGKRPEIFLDLAQALPAYRFKIIGGHDDAELELFEAIRKRASEMPNVEFMGFVPYSRIGEEFDRAKVLVSTSASEGFPNIFLQAWARGIPTVSFVDCGARLEGQHVGQIADSVDDMESIIMRWLSDESVLQREGRRCHDYFFENHSVERVLGLYEAEFEKLLSGDSQTQEVSELRNRNGAE